MTTDQFSNLRPLTAEWLVSVPKQTQDSLYLRLLMNDRRSSHPLTTLLCVNISFPSCIYLIAVSLSFVAVSIFFFSYSISVIAVYPLILSKDLNYCLGLGLKGSDYDD